MKARRATQLNLPPERCTQGPELLAGGVVRHTAQDAQRERFVVAIAQAIDELHEERPRRSTDSIAQRGPPRITPREREPAGDDPYEAQNAPFARSGQESLWLERRLKHYQLEVANGPGRGASELVFEGVHAEQDRVIVDL